MYITWLKQFQAAASLLGLEKWDLSLYVLRHSGPSDDHLAKRRTLDEIQRRGRWSTQTSVRRYEKSARVTSQLKLLSVPQLKFCQECNEHLREIFMGTKRPPPLTLKGAVAKKPRISNR